MSQEHGDVILSLGLQLAGMEQITRPWLRKESEQAQKMCLSIRGQCAKLIDKYGEDMREDGNKVGRSFGLVIKRFLHRPSRLLIASIGQGSAQESTQLVIYDTGLLGEKNYFVLGTENCAVFEGQEKVVPGGIKTRNISLREAKALKHRIDRLKVETQP